MKRLQAGVHFSHYSQEETDLKKWIYSFSETNMFIIRSPFSTFLSSQSLPILGENIQNHYKNCWSFQFPVMTEGSWGDRAYAFLSPHLVGIKLTQSI